MQDLFHQHLDCGGLIQLRAITVPEGAHNSTKSFTFEYIYIYISGIMYIRTLTSTLRTYIYIYMYTHTPRFCSFASQLFMCNMSSI